MTRSSEPSLLTTARTMVANGQPWRDVALELQSRANGDRAALAEAALHWVRQMRRRASDDFQAGAVLRALEAALARTPRAGAGP